MVARLYLTYRGGMGGHGPLPFAGGSAEQPSLLMSAFDCCGEAYALLERKGGA